MKFFYTHTTHNMGHEFATMYPDLHNFTNSIIEGKALNVNVTDEK